MSRYAMLYATDAGGRYIDFEPTPGLSEFLTRIGATDPIVAAQQAQNILRGFVTLPGYEKEMVDCRPVAVRYAPMHLYKRPEMQSIQEFCALSVNGAENRLGERFSVYSATTIISSEDMLQTSGLNYLDQLFGAFDAYGGRWLSDQDMDKIRNGKAHTDLAITPAKISLRAMPDERIACWVVDAVFAGKNVILRLEPDCGFNRRAVELLRQIYSLLPPRLAVETGFAAYQDPNEIGKLLRETSIRIFLIPAGAEVRQSFNDTEFFDLVEEQPSCEPTSVSLVAKKWAGLDWETQRQPAMNLQFRNTKRGFQNPELFVSYSQQFFDAMSKQKEWEKSWESQDKKETITDLTCLKKEYESNQNWMECLPWGKETFCRMIPAMMGKDGLGINLAKQLADAFIAAQRKEMNVSVDSDILKFGEIYGKPDEKELCKLVWEAQDENYRQVISEKDAKIDTAKQDLERAVQEEQKRWQDQTKQKDTRLSELETTIIALNDNLTRNDNELKQKTNEINDLKAELEKKKEELRSQTQKVNELNAQLKSKPEEPLSEEAQIAPNDEKTKAEDKQKQSTEQYSQGLLDHSNGTNNLSNEKTPSFLSTVAGFFRGHPLWRNMCFIGLVGALLFALLILPLNSTSEKPETPATTEHISGPILPTIDPMTPPSEPDSYELIEQYKKYKHLIKDRDCFTENSWEKLEAVANDLLPIIRHSDIYSQDQLEYAARSLQSAIQALESKTALDSDDQTSTTTLPFFLQRFPWWLWMGFSALLGAVICAFLLLMRRTSEKSETQEAQENPETDSVSDQAAQSGDSMKPDNAQNVVFPHQGFCTVLHDKLDCYCPKDMQNKYAAKTLYSTEKNNAGGEFKTYLLLLEKNDRSEFFSQRTEEQTQRPGLKELLKSSEMDAALSYGETVLLVKGDDSMVVKAFKVFKNHLSTKSACPQDKNRGSQGKNKERSKNQQTDCFAFFFKSEKEDQWLDLTEVGEEEWWKSVSSWNTDAEKLKEGTKKICKDYPMLSFNNSQHSFSIYFFHNSEVFPSIEKKCNKRHTTAKRIDKNIFVLAKPQKRN